MGKKEYFTDNSVSFLKFLESAVLTKPGFCIKYYHDGCGTCGCGPFQRKVKKYSEKVILTGLHELLRRDSEAHYTNLIQIRNKDENYTYWYREFEDKFEDAMGLCLEALSEKIDDQDLKEFVERKFFDEQKFLFQIAKLNKWIKDQKEQEKSREQRLIKNKKRRGEHLKRIKAREDAKEEAKKDTKELGI
jgi:hypothetical protein